MFKPSQGVHGYKLWIKISMSQIGKPKELSLTPSTVARKENMRFLGQRREESSLIFGSQLHHPLSLHHRTPFSTQRFRLFGKEELIAKHFPNTKVH